ncbi:hypothetical protein A9Q99_10205 [Gammaproteobacteria bacterium 45_16_T64]|nr:hypothetical protein A9Q99_10205 [Gammaproteobacteria bacterium 45_16_T64]
MKLLENGEAHNKDRQATLESSSHAKDVKRQEAMYEEVLKNLRKSEKFEGALEGELIFKGSTVTIRLEPNGDPIESVKSLALKYLLSLEKYESTALDKLVEDCFSMYNDDWRDEEDPVLTKEEFISNLTLYHIEFLSSDSVDFFHSENDMFGGHSLIPQSFDGESFTYVQMYG